MAIPKTPKEPPIAPSKSKPRQTHHSSKKNVRSIDLALQGGGSHGAFTWGVLDRLLEEDDLKIEGISGTSAGAMNGAVLASGMAEGGKGKARENLSKLWKGVSDQARFSPLQRSPLDVLLGRWSLDYSPAFHLMDMTARIFSPYDLNPMGGNPLSQILNDIIDFDLLNNCDTKLFVTATNVETGLGHIFRNPDITVDVLLASSCLPMMYHAVEIDGQAYWDGGYSGNPSIGPLVRECGSDDTILVQINPVMRCGIPKTATEITNRLNEVSFNNTLIKELRMIALMRQILPKDHEEGGKWASMRMHVIKSDVMLDLDYSSKMNAEWPFLTMLRDQGREAAHQFLTDHKKDLGVRPTVDIDKMAPDAG